MVLLKKLKIAVLTSSRADYGIYTPLLKLLSRKDDVELHLLVFGMHLLEKFGCTLKEIQEDNFGHIHQIGGMPESDDLVSIGQGYGDLIKEFTLFLSINNFDLVLALGDRFEMSAAVQATIPFSLNVAHIHGGEITLGAVDNIYRHQITLVSRLHFVAAESFREKVAELIGSNEDVYNVGALSLDGLDRLSLPLWKEVCEKFNIREGPFLLVTVHPETENLGQNEVMATVIGKSLVRLSEKYMIVITMPNADAEGSLFRGVFNKLKYQFPDKFALVENFGKLNYFSAIRNCEFMLGNTSSGIIEAASFGKYVINVGDRQRGRLRSDNVIDVPFSEDKILFAKQHLPDHLNYSGVNNYYKESPAETIVNILLERFKIK